MSDYEDFDESEDAGESQKNPLRPILRQKEKELKEALARLNKFEAEQRKGTVAELIEKAGGDPRYAKFYTSDDASEDAVKAWIQSESELLGVKAPDEPVVEPTADAVRSIAQSIASTPPPQGGAVHAAFAQVQGAKTREEFEAALAAAFPRKSA